MITAAAATIIIIPMVDRGIAVQPTTLSFNQKLKNNCSGFTFSTNTVTLAFGLIPCPIIEGVNIINK
jgi:hypothetical protein